MASGAFKFGSSIKMAMSTLVPDQIMTSNVQGRKVIFLVVKKSNLDHQYRSKGHRRLKSNIHMVVAR